MFPAADTIILPFPPLVALLLDFSQKPVSLISLRFSASCFTASSSPFSPQASSRRRRQSHAISYEFMSEYRHSLHHARCRRRRHALFRLFRVFCRCFLHVCRFRPAAAFRDCVAVCAFLMPRQAAMRRHDADAVCDIISFSPLPCYSSGDVCSL